MQYDTRNSTLLARMMMSEVIAEELLAAHAAALPAADAEKLRDQISAKFRALIDQAIATIAKHPTAHTSVIIAELPAKRDAILAEVLAIATPASSQSEKKTP